MSERQYCIYIMTNAHNTVLYTGVTNELQRRVLEHKAGKGNGFTKKYNITKLVYFESGDDINLATGTLRSRRGEHPPRNDTGSWCYCEPCTDEAVSSPCHMGES